MGEKTEKATPKKLRDAKKKGQVAKSQDLPSAFTFIVALSVTLSMIPTLYEKYPLGLIFRRYVSQNNLAAPVSGSTEDG